MNKKELSLTLLQECFEKAIEKQRLILIQQPVFMAEPLCCQWIYKEQVVNHLFKVESSNVVAPEVNYDLICISFPLVIRNNNVLI